MKLQRLDDLMRQQAQHRPRQTALTYRSESVTYAELDRLACWFAGQLAAGGVGPDDRVGLLLDKSIVAVAALLGILKAGACYVPLDPRAPAPRIAAMADDARLHGLITTDARAGVLAPLLRSAPPCRLLVGEDLASLAVAGGAHIAAPPRVGQDSDRLAYILYTSGSTGMPKGVMIGHRAALSFVDWAVRYFGLRPDDIVANHAPLHFDLSVFDLFATFAAGGTVALVPSEVALFPSSLAAWIERGGITVWYSVPFALMQLVRHGGARAPAFARLRLILFAGEVYPSRALADLMHLVPHARCYNLYGPTETNVCTAQPIAAPPAPEAPPPPIGAACDHCVVRVVAGDGTPVADGTVGEMIVGGASLMQGYWARPEQTQAAFVAEHCDPGGGRFYRTGDYGWRDEDGLFHFVGRRDGQVKIRGHRVELGDIESVLAGHAGLDEVAVVVREGAAGEPALAAFVVSQGGAPVAPRALALFCGERLPRYMVPRDFIFLECLPRTATGKLDRARLCALPDQTGTQIVRTDHAGDGHR